MRATKTQNDVMNSPSRTLTACSHATGTQYTRHTGTVRSDKANGMISVGTHTWARSVAISATAVVRLVVVASTLVIRVSKPSSTVIRELSTEKLACSYQLVGACVGAALVGAAEIAKEPEEKLCVHKKERRCQNAKQRGGLREDQKM